MPLRERLAAVLLGKPQRRKANKEVRMLKDLMQQKEAKTAELAGLLDQVQALHGDMVDLQSQVVRGFPTDRAFPAGLAVNVVTERVKADFLARIGEGDKPVQTLNEMAARDTEHVASLESSLSGMWR